MRGTRKKNRRQSERGFDRKLGNKLETDIAEGECG